MSGSYSSAIEGAANQYGVPSNLLQSLLMQESSFNPFASNGSAYGIAQFIPETANRYGVDRSDPVSSIYGAANYLSDLRQQKGSWLQAVMSYGTVPHDLSRATTGQMTVADVAQGLDNGNIQSVSWLGDHLSRIGPWGAVTGLLGGSKGSLVEGAQNIVYRIGIFIIALIFMGVGITSLTAGSVVNNAANTLAKALKS